jgi:hypothetical protein
MPHPPDLKGADRPSGQTHSGKTKILTGQYLRRSETRIGTVCGEKIEGAGTLRFWRPLLIVPQSF